MITRVHSPIHPLENQVRTVSRRARWLVWGYAASSFGACLLLTLSAAGILDYWFRFEETGLRILLSLIVMAIVAVAGRRWLVPASRYRMTDVETCQRIERWAPELSGRLASAVAFLRVPENERGSSLRMRIAAIDAAEQLVHGRDFRACLDARPTGRALAALGIAVLLVGAFWAADSRTATLVFTRLFSPWSPTEWPRRNSLEFVSVPRAVAAGQDFFVELIDRRGRLPEHATITYRFGDESTAEERTRPMQRSGDRFTDRLDNVSRSFSIRARGGDDETDWLTVAVREPIRVEDVQLEVIPPAYSGRDRQAIDLNARVLSGSTITIRGRADRALTRASLHVDRESEPPRPLVLGTDRRSFELSADASQPWQMQTDCHFWLELMDDEQVLGGHEVRGEIQVIADDPPAVFWSLPSAASTIGPGGVIRLQAEISDDIELASVDLYAQLADQPPSLEPKSVAVFPMTGAGWMTAEESKPGENPTGHRVVLSGELPSLEIGATEPGAVVELTLVARDGKPQETRSEMRRVTVVTAEDFERRLRQKQSQLLARLVESLASQRAAHRQIADVQARVRETHQANRDTADQLQTAELEQRRVSQRLFDAQEGAIGWVAQLLAETVGSEANRADRERFERLQADLKDLEANAASSAERRTRDASRQLRTALRDSTADQAVVSQPSTLRPLEETVSRALADQEVVRDRIEKWVAQFSGLDQLRNLARELNRVAQEQAELHDETTSRLSSDALSQNLENLPGEDRSALKRLADRQRQLARELDQLLEEIGDRRPSEPPAESNQQSGSDQPSESEVALSDAGQTLRQTAASELMRESGRQLDQNRLGGAAELQQQVLDSLARARQRMSGIASSGTPDDPQGRERQRLLKAAVEEFSARQATLVRRWAELKSATADSGGQEMADAQRVSVANDQQSLADATKEVAQSSLATGIFAFALDEAAGPMQRASELMRSSAEASGAAESQKEAADRLRSILDSLEENAAQPPPDPQEPNRSENPNAAGPSAVVNLAELRMVRALQLELNRRTTALDEQVGGNATPERQTPFEDLAKSEARLAEVVQRLERSERQDSDHRGEDSANRSSQADSRDPTREPDSQATESQEPSIKAPARPGNAQQSLDDLLLEDLPKSKPTAARPPMAPESVPGPDNSSERQPSQGTRQPAGEDVGQPPESAEARTLSQVSQDMREAQSRLERRDAATETQAAQNRAVERLSAMIQAGEQQNSQRQTAGASPKNANQATNDMAGSRPRETSNSPTSPARPALDEPSRAAMLKRVWGHLPSRMRDQIETPLSEQFLPKYEQLIEDYYRRLAEEER